TDQPSATPDLLSFPTRRSSDLPVGDFVEHNVYAQHPLAKPFRKFVGIEGDHHVVVAYIVDHPAGMIAFGLSFRVGENADHLARLKTVGLIELVGTLYFNDETLARADIIASQPDRIPASPVLNPAIKRRQQNLLPVLLQVFLAFFADQFERVL